MDHPYTILYAPGLADIASDMAREFQGSAVMCTSDVLPAKETVLCWDQFPSGDPNLKLRVSAIRDKHIVLLMNHDTLHLFEQLAVLLFVQRFNVPHPEPECVPSGTNTRTARTRHG